MDNNTAKLSFIYTGWGWYQWLLIQAIASRSPDQLALRASPELRAIWELPAHIVAARARIFHTILRVGGPELEPLQAWDREGQPKRSADELVVGLTATWRLIDECLNQWTLSMLHDPFATPGGETLTRHRMIWWAVQHDHHHGGELFLTLGMHGLLPPEFDL